jgi:GT2 family glycosyltransferase
LCFFVLFVPFCGESPFQEKRLMSPEPMTPAAGATPRLASILVACCGQVEYTRLCVQSLLRHTRAPYELHFLDSGSLDGTADYLAGVAAAAAVRVDITRVGATPTPSVPRKDDTVQIRGEFVALLNNDTIVPDGWLAQLIALASSDARIGMVAPLSNYAPPPLLVERVPYRIAPCAETSGSGISAAEEQRTQVEAFYTFARQLRDQQKGKWVEAERLGGGCVLLKRTVLQAIGQFPTRTALGAFDTEGLSQRVRQAGFRLLACGEVFVHHFGSRGVARS